MRIHKKSICRLCADIDTCDLASEMRDTPTDYSIECTGLNPKGVEIYDNEGKSFDRYTILIDDTHAYTMSLHPQSPQGFNHYCGEIVIVLRKILQEAKDALGKKVSFKNLSTEVRNAIIERMKYGKNLISFPREFKVGQIVQTKKGTVAKVIGSALYGTYKGEATHLTYVEYRLRSKGSKRTFYRRESELEKAECVSCFECSDILCALRDNPENCCDNIHKER